MNIQARNYNFFYNIMPDGTVKQINPFTGTEVWAVTGRSSKPIANEIPSTAEEITVKQPEDYCTFCETHYQETAPEKARYEWLDGHLASLYHLSPARALHQPAAVRRVGNLFEIVTLEYWKKNYGYKLTREIQEWRDSYMNDPVGAEHLNELIRFRCRMAGKTPHEVRHMTQGEKSRIIDAFFGGCHDIVIARRHYPPGAKITTQLNSSGDLSEDEHYQYFRFTVDAMRDMLRGNRYIRYVSVFQNWLRSAGASVDHLHKQLVGIDEWGSRLEQQIEMLKHDRNLFNEFGANLASQYNLVFAESDQALAFVGIGHRYPTVEIYSKSNATRPFELADDELRSMSTLVRACHAAMGNQVSCNEEWYYTPIDAVYRIPWHVLLKWRVNTPAGFEGGTNIYINPISPIELRDRLVPRLYELRDKGIVTNFRIAEECFLPPNPLRYYQ